MAEEAVGCWNCATRDCWTPPGDGRGARVYRFYFWEREATYSSRTPDTRGWSYGIVYGDGNVAGNEVRVSGGEDLGETIRWVNGLGLAGMERLYGIPGTLAGAVVGNAGAYGQEIGNRIREVSFWSPKEGVRTLPASDLDFRYRHSLFKERRDWFMLSCTLALEPASEPLQPVSDEILATRLAKYPAGLKCPGSFFKNVIAKELDPEVLSRIPTDFIFYGKIPAGKLLDQVGARGRRLGGALIAPHHANLFVNEEGAASRDMLALARKYSIRVRERFDIELEPEILIVSPNQWL